MPKRAGNAKVTIQGIAASIFPLPLRHYHATTPFASLGSPLHHLYGSHTSLTAQNSLSDTLFMHGSPRGPKSPRAFRTLGFVVIVESTGQWHTCFWKVYVHEIRLLPPRTSAVLNELHPINTETVTTEFFFHERGTTN